MLRLRSSLVFKFIHVELFFVYIVLQVFLRSVGHPNSSWGPEWIGPSSSITIILWALSRGKISHIQYKYNCQTNSSDVICLSLAGDIRPFSIFFF